MNKSEEINELAAALSQAQGAFAPVAKTGNNPFLKSTYVTLDAIIEMTRRPLSQAGLSYAQMLDTEGESLPVLTTILMHSSGQWISSSIAVRAISGKGTNELQELGRSITYMKRYTLAAMLGVSSDEDTDASETGVERTSAPKSPPKRNAAKKETANKPPPTFAKLMAAWKDRWAEAKALGIEVEPLSGTPTNEEIIGRGKELAALIGKAEAWDTATATIAAVIEAGLSENDRSVRATLAHSNLTPADETDVVAAWFVKFLESRDAGGEISEAAGVANAWLSSEMNAQEIPM